jgi:hypothetical protein
MLATPSHTSFQWPAGSKGQLSRWSPGELHGLAVREIQRELDRAEGDHARAVKAGLARLRSQGLLSSSEARDLSKLVNIMHEKRVDFNSLAFVQNGLLRTQASSPLSVSIAQICLEAASQGKTELTSAACGGAVAGAVIGDWIQGSEGAVVGSLIGAAFTSKRVVEKARKRAARKKKAGTTVQSFEAVEPLENQSSWISGQAYRTALNSLLTFTGSQSSLQNGLRALQNDDLITAREYGELVSLINAIQQTTRFKTAVPIIVDVYDKFLLSKDTSPIALMISSIAINSATTYPPNVQERSVWGADIEGAIDGVRIGGALGHPVLGGVIGAGVSSAIAAKD